MHKHIPVCCKILSLEEHHIYTFLNKFPGSLFENHREEWLSGPSLGAVHHSEWGISDAHEVINSRDQDGFAF